MEYNIKFKRIDTGKQWIAGNVKEGKYGPQIGMKKTPELNAYLDSIPDGGWINFNLYKPFDKPKPQQSSGGELNDEIPF
jgi:hypothetical protein